MALELEELTEKVIGCAITVHRELGPGFLEEIYERTMAVELRHAGIPFQRQFQQLVFFRGEEVGRQRYDLLVEERLIVEPKAIKALDDKRLAGISRH